jgi:DNA-binding beta-propeller fold protein YncE
VLALAFACIVGGGQRVRAQGIALTVDRFRLAAAPVAITVAAGSIWVVEETGGMRAVLVRLDPKNGKQMAVFTIGRTGPDFGAAVSAGSFVWAAAGNHVIRVDATRPRAVMRAALPGEATAITVGHGSAWIATIGKQQNTITRLDSSTLAALAHIQVTVQPVSLQNGLGSVWLASTAGLWRINPVRNRVLPAPDPVEMPVRLALAGNRLWLAQQDRLVTGLDRAGQIRARIDLPFPPGAVAATTGRIWVTDNCGCRAGKIALIDTHTHRLLAAQPIGETPVDLVADRTGVWVATFADRTVAHVRPSK